MTIYDIAKESKTSPASVSRYLNNIKIREETRKRIEAVLKKYDFKPNAVARSLNSKSMRTIGILTVDIREPHYATTAYTFEQEFRKNGYNIIICNVLGSVDKVAEYIKKLLSYQVDGIAFIGSIFNILNENLDILNLLKDIPVVIANGELTLPNSNSLFAADGYGVELAVNHLYQKGRRNIYLLYDADTDSAKRKIQGFDIALRRLGLDSLNKTLKVNKGIIGGIEGVEYILSKYNDVDSFICSEDIIAVGVIKKLRQLKTSIGKDIDVIGFNNTIYATMTYPTLTSIDTKPSLQATFLSEMLDKMIQGERDIVSISLKPELVIRESA